MQTWISSEHIRIVRRPSHTSRLTAEWRLRPQDIHVRWRCAHSPKLWPRISQKLLVKSVDNENKNYDYIIWMSEIETTKIHHVIYETWHQCWYIYLHTIPLRSWAYSHWSIPRGQASEPWYCADEHQRVIFCVQTLVQWPVTQHHVQNGARCESSVWPTSQQATWKTIEI